jgi:membrane-bound serine protease (ClpP class)
VRARRRAALALALLGALLLGAAEGGPEAAEAPLRGGPVAVARVDGTINPASSDYLQRAIRGAEEMGASVLLLELDTPGGLVDSTQDIIQAILGARVPVVVFVAPQGAWAGSAGTFITIAGHVAAMAPGSTIGAAHPVGVGGGGGPPPGEEEGEQAPRDYAGEKAENMLAAFIEAIAEKRERNVEWAEKAVRESVAITADKALELGVIDLVADDRRDLLERIDGREVDLPGGPVRLATRGAAEIEIEMRLVTRILDTLAHPNIAVLLFFAGLLGLYVEFNQPGMIVPGAIGLVCLVLALISFQILPFSWVGVLLILAGVGLFVAEVFVTSYGLLFAAGVACLLAGGSMVFERPEVSDLDVDFWGVLVPAVGSMALFAALVVWAVGRTMGSRQIAGVGELVGLRGRATTAIGAGGGTVFVRGEYWRARSEEPIEAGADVEALAVEGMELTVRRSSPRS